MKKRIQFVLIFIFTLLISSASMAQLTEPGDGSGGDPNGAGTPVGGGAPVGGGLALVIGLGLAYGAKKTYQGQLKNLDKV